MADPAGQALNFDVHQLLVGQVDPTRQPANAMVPPALAGLQFVYATCSVTLVEEKWQEQRGGGDNRKLKMVVDCASAYETDKLEQVLRAKGVTPGDVTHLVLTHWHSDHCGNIALFPNAQLITPELVQSKGAGTFNAQLPQGITVHNYGGHSTGDIVVRVVQQVKKTYDAKIMPIMPWNVAIVGDLFEYENDWTAEEPWKHSSLMPDRQIISRFLCWKGADEIIPGHGPSFRVTTSFPHQLALFGQILFQAGPRPMKPLGPSTSFHLPDDKLGYATVNKLLSYDDGEEQRRRNIYLVRGRGLIVLVNTGGPAQRQQLIDTLVGNGIAPDQVTHLVITNPGVSYCHNMSLFKNAKTYLSNDIALPGCYYASLDQYFVNINREIIVWRDMDPVRDNGALSLLVKTKSRQTAQKSFTVIGSKLDAFIPAYMDLTGDDIRLALVDKPMPVEGEEEEEEVEEMEEEYEMEGEEEEEDDLEEIDGEMSDH